MKIIAILLILAFPLWGICQTSPESAILSVTAVDGQQKPFVGEILFYTQRTGAVISAKTDNVGKADVNLPVGETYSAYSDASVSKYDFQVPNYPGLRFQQTFIFEGLPKDEISASPTLAAVNLRIIKPSGGFVQEAFEIRNTATGEIFTAESDISGNAHIRIPAGANYEIDFKTAKAFSRVSIPNEPFYYLDKKIYFEGSKSGGLHPSLSQALITVIYKDLDNKAVSGETITVQNPSTGSTFSAVTDSAGRAQMLVPIGGEYSVNTTHFTKIAKVTVPVAPGKYVFDSEYKNISSKQFERQRKELSDRAEEIERVWEREHSRTDSIREAEYSAWLEYIDEQEELRLRKIADAVAEAEREKQQADSLAEIKIENERLTIELTIRDSIQKRNAEIALAEKLKAEKLIKAKERARRDSLAEITRIAEAETKIDDDIIRRAKYETENNTWGTSKMVVFNVMARNDWKKTLFVVDVTGSMNSYSQSIKNWYLLNLYQQDTADFVFFNDGDGMANKDKQIGNTGGIHFCTSCTVRELNRVMKTASASRGGDIPENDIEALLAATDSIKDYKEVVLLADNNSFIRDYSLISKLSVPIRIVLCGVVNDVINEEYLNIAQLTKGSVHTIDKDIDFLKSLTAGESLFIGNREYVNVNGAFVRYK